VRFMLATANRHKLLEFALILAPHEVVPKPPGVGLPPEGTESFAANARAKVRALSEAVPAGASPSGTGTGGMAEDAGGAAPDFFIADDSGLEVEALDWGPGVISSRYCGREGDDAANIEKLLAALAPPRDEAARRARFVCELACLAADGREFDARGEWWGHIAPAPRGKGGFGYDPVFVPDGSDLTVAQWPDEEKNRQSHRARAARALFACLHEVGLL
jgi:XTP/dITP diphosphohydrolase